MDMILKITDLCKNFKGQFFLGCQLGTDVLNGRQVSNTIQWILIAVLSVGFLLVILYWFSRWEGRKNYE